MSYLVHRRLLDTNCLIFMVSVVFHHSNGQELVTSYSLQNSLFMNHASFGVEVVLYQLSMCTQYVINATIAAFSYILITIFLSYVATTHPYTMICNGIWQT